MDHRDIGQNLELFMFHELSPGSPIWLPKGTVLYNILSNYIRKLNLSAGYNEVRTPVLWNHELYKLSGHWDHYQDNMYGVHGHEEDKLYNLKPMNCPGHMLIFKSKQWSYADLPYRLHDQGVLHRDESSGAIGGLTRCRSFCQDDGHVFLATHQIADEVASMIDAVKTLYDAFGMKVRSNLSLRPESFMGDPGEWDHAEAQLKLAINRSCMAFTEDDGGAFYGPKIDFYVTDSQEREWQTATIQLDFQLPQRFELKYTDNDGSYKTPVVIHRAYYGSFERFIAIILEHYQGKLPLWLAPVQGVILPIADRHVSYAKEILEAYNRHGLRFEMDASNRTLNRKIVDIEQKWVKYALVVGDKECASHTVSVRVEGKDLGAKHALKFRLDLEQEIDG